MVFSIIPRKIISGGTGFLRPIRAYGTSLGITSMAAFIASVPLAALFFGSFSPVSLVGNLIVVPLTFCIVLCGWLSILLPIASGIFNQAAVVFIDLLLGSVQWLDRLPGSSWQVEPPSLLAVLLWYGSLIALFTVCTRPKQRWFAAGAASFALILAFLS